MSFLGNKKKIVGMSFSQDYIPKSASFIEIHHITYFSKKEVTPAPCVGIVGTMELCRRLYVQS